MSRATERHPAPDTAASQGLYRWRAGIYDLQLAPYDAIRAKRKTEGAAAAKADTANGSGEAATADDRAKASQPATAEQKAEARAKRKTAGAAAAEANKAQGSGEAATADDRAKK